MYVHAPCINNCALNLQDPSTRAWMTTLVKEQKRREMSTSSDPANSVSLEWDAQEMYLVCIYNVSPDLPYTILRAPHSSTALDIITQALMKARRVDDPRNYVLLEEVTMGTSQESPSNKAKHGNNGKAVTRILADDDNVYTVQHAWQANAGKFLLTERHKAFEVIIVRYFLFVYLFLCNILQHVHS